MQNRTLFLFTSRAGAAPQGSHMYYILCNHQLVDVFNVDKFLDPRRAI